MSNKAQIFVLVAIIMAGGAGLVIWKSTGHNGQLTKVTKEEVASLVKDLNPMQQKLLAEDPKQKKELAKNIKELFAIASQARKDGFADKPEVKQELKYIKKAILALTYDKHKNKDKSLPPLSLITDEQIKEFWGNDESEKEKVSDNVASKDEKKHTGSASGTDSGDSGKTKEEKNKPEEEGKKNPPKLKEDAGFLARTLDYIGLGWVVADADKRGHEADFEKHLEAQKKLAEERGQLPAGQEIPPEQIKQMRDAFARFTIYAEEATSKLDELGEEFAKKVEFQTQLQQAQVLAQLYAREKLAPQLEVKEEDVTKYIKEHPELVKEKKEEAEEVLKKALDGENFSELAKEFSDDPGSKENGGLYEKVPMGQMIPAFEKAALALKPGDIAPKLVETKFGYHIIKLIKKNESKEKKGEKTETYDTRHILISTAVKDSENPFQQEVPLETFVTEKLKKEKQKSILEKLTADNPIEVAEDFEVTPPPPPAAPVTMPVPLSESPPDDKQSKDKK